MKKPHRAFLVQLQFQKVFSTCIVDWIHRCGSHGHGEITIFVSTRICNLNKNAEVCSSLVKWGNQPGEWWFYCEIG